MAITLEVPLNDAEQARIVEVGAIVAPGMSGAELKAWAESFMKQALRDKVRDVAIEAQTEAANVARRQALEAIDAAWPEPSN